MSRNPKGRNLLTLEGVSQKTAGVNNLTTIFLVEKKDLHNQPASQVNKCGRAIKAFSQKTLITFNAEGSYYLHGGKKKCLLVKAERSRMQKTGR